MDINQEVSNTSNPTTSGLDSPAISKRSATNMVTVQSGETTVLGRLISENSTAGTRGVSFLSSIPVPDGLFGTQSYNNNRTVLIVLIAPRVASNIGQTRMVADEFLKKLKEMEELLD